MKPDAIAFENAIVQVRNIGQMISLMGEGLHVRKGVVCPSRVDRRAKRRQPRDCGDM
jgi:hypothetical protein